MNKLRKELNSMLAAAETKRPPALRRSLREGWLYATDLPQTADPAAVRDFRGNAENAGWRTEEDNGWILMNLPGAVPQDTGFRGPFGREARACASLLQRHPERGKTGERELCRLTGAAEEGPEAFERACAALHREWAAALRRGDPLPDIPDSIFQEEQYG